MCRDSQYSAVCSPLGIKLPTWGICCAGFIRSHPCFPSVIRIYMCRKRGCDLLPRSNKCRVFVYEPRVLQTRSLILDLVLFPSSSLENHVRLSSMPAVLNLSSSTSNCRPSPSPSGWFCAKVMKWMPRRLSPRLRSSNSSNSLTPRGSLPEHYDWS